MLERDPLRGRSLTGRRHAQEGLSACPSEMQRREDRTCDITCRLARAMYRVQESREHMSTCFRKEHVCVALSSVRERASITSKTPRAFQHEPRKIGESICFAVTSSVSRTSYSRWIHVHHAMICHRDRITRSGRTFWPSFLTELVLGPPFFHR